MKKSLFEKINNWLKNLKFFSVFRKSNQRKNMKKILIATLKNWLKNLNIDNDIKVSFFSAIDEMPEDGLRQLVDLSKKHPDLFVPTVKMTVLKMKTKNMEDWKKIISDEKNDLRLIINSK